MLFIKRYFVRSVQEEQKKGVASKKLVTVERRRGGGGGGGREGITAAGRGSKIVGRSGGKKKDRVLIN